MRKTESKISHSDKKWLRRSFFITLILGLILIAAGLLSLSSPCANKQRDFTVCQVCGNQDYEDVLEVFGSGSDPSFYSRYLQWLDFSVTLASDKRMITIPGKNVSGDEFFALENIRNELYDGIIFSDYANDPLLVDFARYPLAVITMESAPDLVCKNLAMKYFINHVHSTIINDAGVDFVIKKSSEWLYLSNRHPVFVDDSVKSDADLIINEYLSNLLTK